MSGLNICFLMGWAGISGGTYVLYQHIRHLRQNHNVILLVDKIPSDSDLSWFPEAKEFQWKTFSETQNLKFDVAVISWWETAYKVPTVNASSYLYFCQSIESRFYPDTHTTTKLKVDATYTLPVGFITEAGWIKNYLSEKFNHSVELVRNGIQKESFRQDGPSISPREPGKLRVLIEGPLGISFKNVEKTIELCKKSLADEIWLLTSSPITSFKNVNKVFSKVPIYQTPAIYRSCDVIVKLSLVEGMFGPPLEMFHCGGTAIVYNITGHDEYILNNVNALVLNTHDEDGVVNAVNKLKTDRQLLQRLKDNAITTANHWHNWDSSSVQFEQSLVKMHQSGLYSHRQRINESIKTYEMLYYLAKQTWHEKASNKWMSFKVWIRENFPRIFKVLQFVKNSTKKIHRPQISF